MLIKELICQLENGCVEWLFCKSQKISLMNYFTFIAAVLCALSCSKQQLPEGHWQASPSEKSEAKNTRILNVNSASWTHISKDIVLFDGLERLNFQNNTLEELPEYIDKLSNLKRLNLAGNNLEELPEALKKLNHLERLNISDNKFSNLPKAILGLSNLEVLDLRNNNLSELPKDLTKLEKLNAIYIGGNNFTEEQRKIFRKWLPYTKIILRSEKRK